MGFESYVADEVGAVRGICSMRNAPTRMLLPVLFLRIRRIEFASGDFFTLRIKNSKKNLVFAKAGVVASGRIFGEEENELGIRSAL